MPWQNVTGLAPKSFECGHCGNKVGAHQGFVSAQAPQSFIYVCPMCDKPTYIDPVQKRIPGARFGQDVAHVPTAISELFNEARSCCAFSAYTATVLLCRKLLMNIAVGLNAPENKPFIAYVEYLADQGYVPPNGKIWVDHIRKKGNEATHEIKVMTEQDAQDLIGFSEMLLKFIYEFPGKIAPQV